MNHTFLFLLVLLLSFTSLGQLSPNFTANQTNICEGETVNFQDLTTPSGSISAWNWDFGDGNSSTQQNPSHTYTAAGTYTVILVATHATSGNASAEVKENFITVNPLPNVNYNINNISGCSLPVTFTFTNVQPSGANFEYEWDFGNGQTASTANPGNITYPNEGTFTVTLTVTNTTTSCSASLEQELIVNDYMADFVIANQSVCQGTSVSFQDASSTGTNQWNWDFGNGQTSTSQNPSVTYNNPGTYTVTLSAQNTTIGCSDTYTTTVEVFPRPNVTFSAEPTSGCAPLEVTFTNTSGVSGDLTWVLGDGTTITNQESFTHTYTENGNYSPRLTIVDENGCTGTVQNTNLIRVSEVIAEFESDVQDGCEILEVNFTDVSQAPNPSGDPISTWEWDFGNGSTFSGQNPPTQEYEHGVYDVTLTVTTASGCSASITLEEYIEVGVLPEIEFTVDPFQDCAKSNFEFTNNTVINVPHDEEEIIWSWEFGDGGESSEKEPTYSYPIDTGYFDVQLIVTYRGCSDTLIQEELVYIDAPISLFELDEVYCNPDIPLTVEVQDDAIIGKETDDCEMIWDWGDGNQDVFVSPAVFDNNPGTVSHTYNAFGSYTIKQVIHNYTTGCSDSTEVVIELSNITANFEFSTDTICRNDEITLTNTSQSTHPLTDAEFLVELTLNPLSGDVVTHTYEEAGEYDVLLVVTNSLGCSDQIVLGPLVVLELPLVAIGVEPIDGCAPVDVTVFDNTTSVNGYDIVSWEWTLPDGSNSTNEEATFNAPQVGSYTTSLTVEDAFGCAATTNRIITLSVPVANFDIAEVVCNNTETTATNTSSNVVSSEWYVDGVFVGTGNQLNHFFSFANTPTDVSATSVVKLVVTNSHNCKDSIEKTVTISAPHADFDYVFNSANVNAGGDFTCPPVLAGYTDQSNSFGNIVSWNYNFGDGKSSSLQNPNNTYVFAGTYSASMVITDEYGCQDSVEFIDYLTIGGPKADIGWTQIGDVCDPEWAFTISNPEDVVRLEWNINGQTYIDEYDSIIKQFGMGTYSSYALITDGENCSVMYELDDIIVLNDKINAQFIINSNSIFVDEEFTITDQSSGGVGGIQTWQWDTTDELFFNDGGTFGYTFPTPGVKEITLIVTDAANCKDTFTIEVYVMDKPIVPNIFTPNGDGVNDVFTINEHVFESYQAIIMNRWGNVMTNHEVVGGVYLWNGITDDGQLATEGTYFYKITGTLFNGEEAELHGYVQLVRENK